MPTPLGSRFGRSPERTCVPANGRPAGHRFRKTSLLRIVPTACGQAADIWHRRDSAARDFHRAQRNHVQCSEMRIGRDVSVTIDSRSDPSLHDVRYHATLPKPSARVTERNCLFDGRAKGHRCHRRNATTATRRQSNPDDPGWWSQTGSNRRPPACKAGALPTELWPRTGTHAPH
jgi:hypothetical protein